MADAAFTTSGAIAPAAHPAPRMIDVWIVRLQSLANTSLNHPFLSQDDREAAGASDALRAAGRVALRAVLGRCCGQAPGDLRFEYGPNGKPALIGRPICFNFTRRGDLALIALAGKGRIGVDLERICPLPELDAMLQMLHPDERALVQSTPEAQRLRRFYQLWTRKEAALKAHGAGLSHSLDTFSVVSSKPSPCFAKSCLVGGVALTMWPLQVGKTVTAALATEDGTAIPRLRVFPHQGFSIGASI